jgi:hypothetical protein
MDKTQLNKWLAWREELGLPPVSQDAIDKILSECVIIETKPEPPLKVYTVKRYLWGLIKIYKPLKIHRDEY